jgi:transposase
VIRYKKISDYILRKVLRCFCEDLTATQTAKLTGVSRVTINRYYKLFRQAILQYQESINGPVKGEIELDESYFGKGHNHRRGRGTDKIPVFGILKRQGRVYTQIIKNARKRELMPIVKRLVERGSTVYTDTWKAYDGLVFDGYKHYRINHGKEEYGDGRGNHVNGIENFWSFSKRRLRKFNGIRRQDFLLHLKECEFRYNERGKVYAVLESLLI